MKQGTENILKEAECVKDHHSNLQAQQKFRRGGSLPPGRKLKIIFELILYRFDYTLSTFFFIIHFFFLLCCFQKCLYATYFLLQTKNILLVHGDLRPFLFIVVIYHIWCVFCQSLMFSMLCAFLLTLSHVFCFMNPKR